MRTVSTPPNKIREDEYVLIPLSDGVRLAARVWRPVGSEENPVPAILEFIPYRRRDLTAQRDSIHHPYMAGHGYACVRVDLRGSGDSEGILRDEYLEQELVDAEEVLSWIAEQPWCDGHTGMMGISWGGFNALQVAARRPESLRAIVTASSTDDRYSDDVHYMGGCLLGDNLSWASTMFAYNSCPPDPALVGEGWREMWHERLEHSGLWLDTWLRHQHRDEYWKHGSVAEDMGAVQVPVMAVSGWADGYSNSVFRLMAGLSVPRLGLLGPWSHKYPHLGKPGPAIGFLQELVRWWDRWLKDVDNDVMDAPMLRAWMQDSVEPSSTYDERPGRWVGEDSWPSPSVVPLVRPLGPGRILDHGQEPGSTPLTLSSPLSTGQYAGKWCSYTAPPDLPSDQREEDGGSMVFDSGPLPERLEILGAPVVNLELSVDKPDAMIAVRLSDVAPDGEATRVTYGLLNLTHRNSDEVPERLEPGRRYRVSVTLNGIAQAFPPGHRLRIAVSTSYWPLAWPSPERVMLSVHPGEHTQLLLPVRSHPEASGPEPVAFDEPEGAPPIKTQQIVPGEERWDVSHDLVHYRSSLNVVKDLGTVLFDDIDLEVVRRAVENYGWVANDYDTVRGETIWTMGFRRGDWSVETVTRTVLTSSPTHFHVHATLDAYEGTERVVSKIYTSNIPRDHV